MSSYKGADLIEEDTTIMTSPPTPKALPPRTIILWMRTVTYEFWSHTNIQPVAGPTLGEIQSPNMLSEIRGPPLPGSERSSSPSDPAQ